MSRPIRRSSPHLLEEGWDIHYIGTKNGIERTLIEPMQGVTYHAVSSGKVAPLFRLEKFHPIPSASSRARSRASASSAG